ncbi:MAG: ferritin family protein [Thermodesulfobacteriota bacterium]
MAYDFNADEVFEMAEQIERNGMKFYQKAAETIEDDSHKELLQRLAGMEKHHEKVFADMRSELSGMEKQEATFDPDQDAAEYLRALADTRVFFKKSMDFKSMKEILTSAIAAEKDSIVFYLGMKGMVPAKWGADKLDLIIKEEMSHITILARELAALKK